MDARAYATDLGVALRLCGEELAGLDPEIRAATERAAGTADPREQAALASRTKAALAGHSGEAERRLRRTAEAVAGLRRRVAFDLEEAAPGFGVDPYLAGGYAELVLRAVAEAGFEEVAAGGKHLVSVAAGGVGGATSRKWKNLRVNRHKLVEFTGHGVVFGLEGTTHPNPLLLAAGLALLINCAREAVTVHIPEQEASVLWGLIRAQSRPGNEDSSPEPDVVAVTNEERQIPRGGTVLGAPLPPAAVRRSLEFLETVRCAAREGEAPVRWRLVESHRVR
ncbi:MAG: hypothetical protein C0501_17580 [Isosphaera sp.]|nr:hypothetical protein [Isosphaera sp.]